MVFGETPVSMWIKDPSSRIASDPITISLNKSSHENTYNAKETIQT
jgi:hypothetical protein